MTRHQRENYFLVASSVAIGKKKFKLDSISLTVFDGLKLTCKSNNKLMQCLHYSSVIALHCTANTIWCFCSSKDILPPCNVRLREQMSKNKYRPDDFWNDLCLGKPLIPFPNRANHTVECWLLFFGWKFYSLNWTRNRIDWSSWNQSKQMTNQDFEDLHTTQSLELNNWHYSSRTENELLLFDQTALLGLVQTHGGQSLQTYAQLSFSAIIINSWNCKIHFGWKTLN